MADTPPRRRRNSTPPDDRPPMPEDSPPKQERKPPKEEPVNPPGAPIKVLQDRLTRFFVGMALPFAAAGDMHCAAILAQRGPIVAEAWANLAKESPAVRKVLEGMLKGGAWAGAISTTLAMVVPIAAHHGAPIPDFASAVLFGNASQASQAQRNEEDVIVTPPPETTAAPAPGVTPAPGPAAYSAPGTNGNGADPSDPAYYPGLR